MSSGNSEVGRRSTVQGRRAFIRGVAAVGIGSAALSTGAAASDHGPTEINEPGTVIDEPGDYVLVNDLVPDADPDPPVTLRVEADDVTLDGQGYTVAGSDVFDTGDSEVGTNGLLVNDAENVTIKDLRAQDAPEGTSVWRPLGFANVNDSVLENVTTTGETGIYLGGDRNEILESDVELTGAPGTSLSVIGDDNEIRRFTTTNIGDQGIVVRGESNLLDEVNQSGFEAGFPALLIAGEGDHSVVYSELGGDDEVALVRVESSGNCIGCNTLPNVEIEEGANDNLFVRNTIEGDVTDNGEGNVFR